MAQAPPFPQTFAAAAAAHECLWCLVVPCVAMPQSKRAKLAAANPASPLSLYRQAARLLRKAAPGTDASQAFEDAATRLRTAITALEPECVGCTGVLCCEFLARVLCWGAWWCC
jgi:erythromycin esterase-like protein